jgi:hypothetical protein
LPDVAVIVIIASLTGTLFNTSIDNKVDPFPWITEASKERLIPGSLAVATKETASAKPFKGLIVIVEVA